MRVQLRSLLMVVVFVVVTGLLIAVVGLTFGRFRLQAADTYKAHFTDASGLTTSSDVRGSGVAIGNVKSIDLDPDGGVLITFTVPRKVQVTSATHARIRYANLTGDRYLDLTPGEGGAAGRPLPPEATIPKSNTQAALDLDSFLDGFNPLMEALSPEQVNQLAVNILAVTQGQSGAVSAMLTNVGSFTDGLADRDKLIGEVIDNLAKALNTVVSSRGDFADLIAELARLMKGLDADRKPILDSLHSIGGMADDISDLVEKNEPGLTANLDQVGAMSRNLNKQSDYMNWALGISAQQMNKIGRLGAYGSFFNFFLCSLQVEVVAPGTKASVFSPKFNSDEARCNTPAPTVPGGAQK